MERPILFNTSMVKAIQDSKKTQTRRIIKPQPKNIPDGVYLAKMPTPWLGYDIFYLATLKAGNIEKYWQDKSPCLVGDILWVRETWQHSECFDFSIKNKFCYKEHDCDREMAETFNIKWKPSIHMPREAARIFLPVTSIKPKKLQDISEEDAKAEGIRCYTKDGKVHKYCVNDDLWRVQGGTWQNMPRTAKEAFLILWDSIYSSPVPVIEKGIITHYESFPWEDIQEIRTYKGLDWIVCGNPWVWVYEFTLRV